jgi:hypothetical protein
MHAELSFEPSTHSYTLGDKKLPSVTQVLRFLEDFEHVPQHLLEAAAQFGRHVHEACHLHNLGVLDWDRLDGQLEPYVRAYDKFLVESGFVVTASEERVANAVYGYAGTLDVRGLLNKRPTLIDIKSTATLSRTVGPQTAAYEKCMAVRHARAALHLRPDGTYRFTKFTEPTDWPMFQSCLNLNNWKNRHAT